MRHIISNIVLFPTVLLTLVSCSSTEVIPEHPDSERNLISISVLAPTTYQFGGSTRVESSHQLRFIAHIYPIGEEGNTSVSPQPLSTFETVNSHPSDPTNLTFEIENPGRYCVTVFADYIPTGSSASGNGHYPDKYYNTTNGNTITTIVTSGDFFNNDHRDCFVGKAIIEKGLNAYSADLTLIRPVSRILVAAPSDPVEQLINTVDITTSSHLESYTFTIDGDDTTIGTPKSTATNPLAQVGQARVTPDGKSLFYFYTFAGQYEDSNRPSLGNISIKLNPKTDIKLDETERLIESGLIQPAANYRFSINGSKGWITTAPGGDDITVNITVNSDWGLTEEKPL